ncbi:phosphopantetheine-binding protein [Streptomyces huasconensis]|uniref:phosphopantetheine-binding protein n=1 Tax=Streptomyces huasconensis TaxID=1854574 RepID=UPI0037032990
MGVGEVETAAVAPAVDPALNSVVDDVEKRLIAIVGDRLNVRCTPEDNFFALGGGSLDALHVLATIREEFGARIRLRAFFRAGTIRELRHLMGDVA